MRNLMIVAAACMLLAAGAVAQELPPIKPIPRLLPPQGVKIEQAEREKLEARLEELNWRIKNARNPQRDLLADIEIYTKAVRWALDFDEFYDAKKDIAKAHAALDKADHRLHILEVGQPETDWVNARGLVVRGYRSDIDDSVQPYGLHIPPPDKLDLTKPVPLLVWLHGRGDKETDLHFIATREKNKGEFAPDWCITLHPFGRGTIGFKFAGEIDVLDAIESVKKRYKIDEDRIALAGFSMGGAGAWHIGAHYADRFCVVHAGAGFVETAKYNRLTPDKYPAWYEQKLWGWYDVPCYTRNLFNVPVIAYSGENDKQKQAADLMAEAFKAEGRELRHIIGPGVEHKYEAKAKEQVLAEIKKSVEKGRDRSPKEVHLQTRTLRYKRMFWVEIERVQTQWDDTRIDVKVLENRHVEIKTRNVASFILHRNEAWARERDSYHVDGQGLGGDVRPDRDKNIERFVRTNGNWEISEVNGASSFQGKVHGIQGTIDDAFMEPFVLVTPSKRTANEHFYRWADFEFKHCVERWRAAMRGDPRVMDESKLDTPQFKRFHLVLWGEPRTHRWLGMILTGLSNPTPITWAGGKIAVGDREFDDRNHVPAFITRNTFQLDRYLVVNSGPTFREGHDRTNSQQTPKLPDWAIIGLDKDPDAFAPGEIKAAGFFDENWKVKAKE